MSLKHSQRLTNSLTSMPAAKTGLAKVAVQCSADSFVVNQTLVLRINICGENRHLRQARKRYAQFTPVFNMVRSKLNIESINYEDFQQ